MELVAQLLRLRSEGDQAEVIKNAVATAVKMVRVQPWATRTTLNMLSFFRFQKDVFF